jgi:6-phosphofructokinase 1
MKIGVLTSGGDSPGMNAALLGVVRRAAASGAAVTGFLAGYRGLLNADARDLNEVELIGKAAHSGTVLKTSREPRMTSDEGINDAVATVRHLGLDALVVVGGNGSLTAAAKISGRGVPVVGIPGTIDGDVSGSPSLGMDSALNYAVSYIEALRVTAESLPDRCFLVETLGGSTGWLARDVAEICLAPAVLVPEEPTSLEAVAQLMNAELQERHYSIAVMSEGVGSAVAVGVALEEALGERIRPCVIGHSMRGAPVSAQDRRLGLLFGESAVSRALAGESGVLRHEGNRIVLDAFPST